MNLIELSIFHCLVWWGFSIWSSKVVMMMHFISTKANIVITEDDKQIFLYRHYDGYPEVAYEHLKSFMSEKFNKSSRSLSCELVATELIQSHTISEDYKENMGIEFSYKLTHGYHCDIEYIYIIDIKHKQITAYASGEPTETAIINVFNYNETKNEQ